MPTKDEILTRLRASLATAAEVRARLAREPAGAAQRQALRSWQAGRLAATYADLLASPRYRATAQFFLSDIYGPKDLTRHEDVVRTLEPLIVRTLPATGLETVADAIELNALSETLDALMIAALEKSARQLDAESYADAYRTVGRRTDRERQIDLIYDLGKSLDSLTRTPLIGTTLMMMRKPAKLAGLGDLQDFLERGYNAFRGMKGADEFLNIVRTRERALLESVFGGSAEGLGTG